MRKSLYLIDGHYQIYRAFYSAPDSLTSPSGEPTGAVHIFCMMLRNLIRTHRPDYLAMLMDVSDETVFRRDIDPNYKAHRDPAPESLHTQADRIVTVIEALRIPLFRVPGYEADDVMATIAHILKNEEINVYLVSRDKDLDQLLSDRVWLFDPVKNTVMDAAGLQEIKGYSPEQAVEIQSLVGDSTDNIPGVHGVGMKTAVKLINQYGSAEAVLEHADELTPKMSERVKAYADQLPITRQLVTLRKDVPLSFELEKCDTNLIDVAGVLPLFDELGFTTVKDKYQEMASMLGGGDEIHIEHPPQPVETGTYELVDTDEKLDAFVKELSKQNVFAFDTETTGIHPVKAKLVGLSFCWQSSIAYYIPVRAVMGNVLSVETVVEKLKPIMENEVVRKVGHNLKYDILVLKQVGIEVQGNDFDTMLASFLLDPMRRSHSLDALTSEIIGHTMIPISDLIGKGKNQITIDQIDTQRVCEYASEDADFTWRLYEILEKQMTGSHVEPLFRETEMPLIDVLAAMEQNGISLDTKLLATLSESMGERIEELALSVHEAAERPFNIDSPKQLGEVLFDDLGFKPVRKTKTGRSTDADTLQTLTTQYDHPIPGLVLQYRELTKLKNTYVDTLPKMICERTGRIHASFHQAGVVTGRLSSSDPNLQNIPIRTETGRQIREAFIASSPDLILLVADYSQIELRLLAHFCQDVALLKAFRDGLDIHRAVAAQVNGVKLEEVTSEQRSAAKAVNFGIIYGQSPFGLAKSLGISVGEAKAFIDMYFMRYPGIRLFIDRCVDDAKRTGYAETILGRRRPIPELQSRNKMQTSFGERIAVNTVVQGSAADLIKRAMLDIHQEIQSGTLPAKMLIQVHDELVFEVPSDQVESAADRVREKMQKPFKLDVPIEVDIGWGRTWGQSK